VMSKSEMFRADAICLLRRPMIPIPPVPRLIQDRLRQSVSKETPYPWRMVITQTVGLALVVLPPQGRGYGWWRAKAASSWPIVDLQVVEGFRD
jgi:hypothetical protein